MKTNRFPMEDAQRAPGASQASPPVPAYFLYQCHSRPPFSVSLYRHNRKGNCANAAYRPAVISSRTLPRSPERRVTRSSILDPGPRAKAASLLLIVARNPFCAEVLNYPFAFSPIISPRGETKWQILAWLTEEREREDKRGENKGGRGFDPFARFVVSRYGKASRDPSR